MIICEKCKTKNRECAMFCKHCGSAIGIADAYSDFFGKENIIPELENFKKQIKFAKLLESNNSHKKLGFDCLILGDSGTGKRYLANFLFNILLKAKVICKSKPEFVDASDIVSWSDRLDENLSRLKGGILIITNVHKLLPDETATSVTELDGIFSRMKNDCDSNSMPTIFLLGLRDRFSAFLENNPDTKSLFEFKFELKPFSDTSLAELCYKILQCDYKCDVLSSDVKKKIVQRFSWLVRNGKSTTNGHIASVEANTIAENVYLKNGTTVKPEHVVGDIFIPKSEDDVLKELDNFIGLQEVKDEIKTIISTLKATQIQEGKDAKVQLKDHYVFTGNPGTGKTTIARFFADILNSMGVLSTGQLVEISGKDLIGKYVGSSEALVQEYVDRAQGGILFIDEAYGLNDDNYGKNAIDKLLPLVENLRGNFICILAGYSKEMGEFMRVNAGLESRFNKTIHFPDYNAKELCQIFMDMVKSNGYKLSHEAKDKLIKKFEKIYLSRTDTFGNARVVRNIFEKSVERHNKKLVEMSPSEIQNKGKILEWDDIASPDETKEISVEDVMAELNVFVGMNSVKKEIRELAGQMAYNQKRLELGYGKIALTPVNIVLTGNPGTGKTSVARIFGKLFKAMGLIPTNKVIEKERSDIVGKYVNESDKNMDKAVNEAMGGVLFIEEAYNIAPVDELGHCTDTEGTKAIERLMTRMENDRGKFVLVCAGYKKQMDNFLRVNAGLNRRFTHFIHIDDYTPFELTQIYLSMADKEGFVVEAKAKPIILNAFESLYASRDEKFGNAGEARKLLGKTQCNHATRLRSLGIDNCNKEMMCTITSDDIPYEAPKKVSPEDCLKELDDLVGLQGVKNEMRKLIAYINREQTLAEAEGKKPNVIMDHYLFLGNPGTGKTTVARLMGKILYSMGVIKKPDVIEVNRDNLVAGYLGQTAEKTKEIVKQSLGGILFIDEAYALNNDNFGAECINTLVPLLENNKGKFVCIAAGYTKEMQDFLRVNSGLKSRFTKVIEFEDYNSSELFMIFMNKCHNEGLLIDKEAEPALKRRFKEMYDNRLSDFGNAREARNYFDAAKQNLAVRTIESNDITELKTIKIEDLP